MIKNLYRIKASGERSSSRYLFPLYASVLGAFLCIGCLAGATWAWFNASLSADTQIFAAANSSIGTLEIEEKEYKVTAQVVNQDGEELSPGSRTSHFADVDYSVNGGITKFKANSGTLYSISFVMDGTADTQMLMVETPDGDYYTTLENSEFNIVLENSGVVSVYASWGKPSDDALYFPNGRTGKIGAGTEDIPDIQVKVIEEDAEDTDLDNNSDRTEDLAEESGPNTENTDTANLSVDDDSTDKEDAAIEVDDDSTDKEDAAIEIEDTEVSDEPTADDEADSNEPVAEEETE